MATTSSSSSASPGSSGVVESSVMDLELPRLAFHQMCWAREQELGARTVLVSANCLQLPSHFCLT